MSKIWYNGTINARSIGNGNFISTDIQKKRVSLLQNNSEYREKIEAAQRMAGYEDKLLLAARGGMQEGAIKTLLNQTDKAESITKDKNNETVRNGDIIIRS